MSNQLIHFPPSLRPQSTQTESSVWVNEAAKLIEVTSNGGIVCSSISDKTAIKEATFVPDFTRGSLKLIKFAHVRTPFNFFQQVGTQSIVGLYEDGRLRFWDFQTGRCYLETPLLDIKHPAIITFMGTVLSSRKRFLYLLSTLISNSQ